MGVSYQLLRPAGTFSELLLISRHGLGVVSNSSGLKHFPEKVLELSVPAVKALEKKHPCAAFQISG